MLDRITRPQTSDPEFRGRLGRRMAIVFLPLILIPLLILGIGAYLRSRSLLEAQASSQMTSAAQSQVGVINEWASDREERLQLGSQRSELRQAASILARSSPGSSASRQASGTALIELKDLKTRQGELLFSEMVLVRLSDGEVLASTNPDWTGEITTSVVDGIVSFSDIETNPIYNEGLFSPKDLAFLTTIPLQPANGENPEVVLVGVNIGPRLGALMTEMQIFWEQRGVYRVERGRTFVLLAPDVLVELLRYGTSPEAVDGQNHPIFTSAQLETSGVEEYPGPEGDLVLAAYEWIPEWDIGIVAELPQEDIFAEINDLAPFIIILIVAATVLTIVAVIVIGNRMLKPLGTLTEFSAQLARGEWGSRVPEDRDDEIGALAHGFNRMADDLSGLYRSLEDRVDARTLQVRTASEVARAVISTPSLDDLLRRAVELIKLQFDYYHVSIFLLDDKRRYAVLRESSGEIGQAMLAQRHQIEVGSASVIGWVCENNQSRVASDVGKDPVHLQNELLPETRSELAVPLQIEGQVIGALDVQSTEPDAFRTQDIEVMQTLADQLSAAIQNARLTQISATVADRARLISEITTELSRPMDIEDVMQTTARAIQRALGQPEVIIEIHTEGNGRKE
jgi:putative methionine-R-sulfoxide reductase with GAF domain/HAMP domain-containing protein